ncbi:putative adenylylsulfate reductase-associated electron transfer protein QmoC [Archaeoglobus sulfaticallidus PM70-1]|uniref:Putative adenylylsulfate reductase-associated electron transfer protein QmoC n=1 Tax=Archaeoglobus sulfaticallidus PM70-1 TaxID=387631 RepID=N0BN76_9EURY|nr:quinone-interacting membrane-bound oxidoreductase complex subunit QmoC [Archaeoglobus sulfaticallidus]AGK62066.1 putative adenylylsulfate reductase-associated electron transfer protein QmoC [Archaeoglobus sulfaticallidus PM70-1]
MKLNPDINFVKDLMKMGGSSLKKCFQCATCSVVCPLSPDDNPYPRKEMIWAQWGLKDKLLKDPDIWLCHQCNDCSINCPRGAKPGEALNAIRNYIFYEYSTPKFMGKLFTSPVYLPILIAIPIILLYAFLQIPGVLLQPEGEGVVYGNFINHLAIEVAGMLLGAYVIVVALISFYKYWKAIGMSSGMVYEVERGLEGKTTMKAGGFWYEFWNALRLILKHSRFAECSENKYRYYAHLGAFYGFILLGISTLGAVAYMYLLGVKELALPVYDPVKIIGNIGFLLIFGGMTWIVYTRLANSDRAGKPSYQDWFFITDLYLVIITGILMEILRFANAAEIAYPLYMVHLVLVFMLLAYAPYSKFAHLMYRGLAYMHARKTGRLVEK